MNLDIQLLSSGPITKYFSHEFWESNIKWFRENNYKIVQFDAEKWITKDNMYNDLHDKFIFDGYFGRNLDALADSLRHVEVAPKSGLLMTIENFDLWWEENKKLAYGLLDVFADLSYNELVFGRKVLVLIRSNDPRLEIKNVGARPVNWNSSEWSNRSRGL